MSETVADYLVNRLFDWGVRRIYGFPGDGINGIMGALNRGEDKVRFIKPPHEELAAFMACAHAKLTGQVGVCLATSGPGAIHLLNGLYDAAMDHAPVVAIVGQQATTALGGDYQQEVDLVSLFKDVAHNYVKMVTTPVGIRTLTDQAMRIARAQRCVTCIIVPNDLQESPMEAPPRKHGSVITGVGYSEPRVIPREVDLRRAAMALNEGKRVAMLVGAGTIGAHEEVTEVAKRLGAGVAKALLGKAALPDDLPYVTGAIGLLGTKPSWDLMQECDTLLMVGTSFPYSEFLPKEGRARGVQVDISPRALSLRYPMEVPLHGDARETLRALLPMLKERSDRSWQKDIEESVRDWWALLEERAHVDAKPINPQRVFWELSPRLPEGCTITSDSGSSANWFARDIKIRAGMKATLSGNLATMCPGVPYALTAKICSPDRPAVALVGDGAMQMLGNTGLITVAKMWREWKDPRLVVAVLDNCDLNQVTWEQRVMEGEPKFATSQDVFPFDYAAYAEQLGLLGIRVDKPDDIGKAWDRALAADRPCVLDFVTDPDVPPLPPHITFAQARAYLSSIAKGDPDALGTATQSFKDAVASWFPGIGKKA